MHGLRRSRVRPRRLLFQAATGLLLVAGTGALQAQILNIEKRRLEKREDKRLIGNIGGTFSYNNRSANLLQPTRVMNAGIDSSIAYFSDRHLHMLVNNYQTLIFNENPIVNFGYTHYRSQFFEQDFISYEIFGQYQYDRPRGLALRMIAGGGPRFRLLKTEFFSVALGTALMYEAEDWHHPTLSELPVEHARYAKSSSYLSARYEINEKVDLNTIVYYQVGYDRERGALHRVNCDVNFLIGLFDKVSLTSSFNMAWESNPLVPIIPWIFMVTNSAQYKF
jgi:hypothetical protein